MFRNQVFRLRIVQKYAVPSLKDVDLLMLRKCVFRLRHVQIWAMLPFKDFDLLILRNCVLRLRNVQIWIVPPCYVVDLRFSEIAFQASKRSNMGSAVLEDGASADNHDF